MNTREITPSQPAPTFAEIATQAVNWDAQFSEMDLGPLNSFELTKDRLNFDKNSVPMNQDARDRLFEKVGAPSADPKKRSTDVQILALRDHFQQGDFGPEPKLVLRDGELFTIRRDNLIELAHADVLNGVAESLGQSVDTLNVSRIGYADGRLELDLVSPAKAIEVRQGDVVTAGLHIDHSRYGDQATQIQGFVYRLVCENGMTRRECVSATPRRLWPLEAAIETKIRRIVKNAANA
jgi:hypothetical protein